MRWVKNLSQDSKGNLKKCIIVMAQSCSGLPKVTDLGKGSSGTEHRKCATPNAP